MKRTYLIRILSMVMTLALLLPMASASADVISSSGWITGYSEMDINKPLQMSVPPLNNYTANNLGGWYQVPGQDGSMVYVPAFSVTVQSGVTTPPPGTVTTPPPGTVTTPPPSGSRPPVITATIPQGTPVYDVKGIYGGNGPNPTYIASTTSFSFTKVDEEWYTFSYNGSTYYYPYTYIINGYNGSSGGGTNTPAPSGTSFWYRFMTNTNAYFSPSTSAGVLTIPAYYNQMVTKVDSSWYSLSYNGTLVYVPASSVGDTGGSGGTTGGGSNKDDHKDGDTFTHILSSAANAYREMSISSSIVAVIQANQPIQITKKSSSWYAMQYNGAEVYLTATDVLGNSNAGDGGQYRPGEAFTRTLLVAANAYSDKSTSSTLVTTFAGGQTLSFTKIDETWCSALYNNQTVYLTLKSIYATTPPDPGEGIKENESFSYTTKNSANAYKSMDVNSQVMVVVQANTLLTLTKKSSTWYSMQYNGTEVYLRNTEVFGLNPVNPSTDPGSQYQIGQSFGYKLTKLTNGYTSKSTTSSIAVSFPANTSLTLTKLDANWYSTPISGGVVYLYAYDLFSGGTSGGGTNTDGVITTALLQVNITSGTLNMRKQARAGTTIMARIPKGAQVSNLGYERDGSGNLWYKTTYDGRTGYVLSTYVTAVGSSIGTGTGTGTNTNNLNPSLDIGRYLYVDVVTVNVRTGPGPSYNVVGRLDRDALVIPLSYKYGDDGFVWYEFQFNNNTRAYIRYDYLRGSLSATATLSGNVAIKAGGTNIRSGPGDSYGLITRFNRDEIVNILSNTTDSSGMMWYRVTNGIYTGYVRYDMVRPLSTSEIGSSIGGSTVYYTELKYGSKGEDVRAMQQALINKGFLAAGGADGAYGSKTRTAVRAFQAANGLSQTGTADSATQALLFGTSATGTGTGTSTGTGSTKTLDWYGVGYALINANKYITVYDVNAGVTWSARYVEGANHADVVPASAADAQKLSTYKITGSYVRRPVIVTIAGQKYAGSMYAEGHGSQNFVSYFNGVMCIHFSGSRTHGTNNVDADHQNAINNALNYGNSVGY